LRRLRAKLTQANGGTPTQETFLEIASAIGVSVKDVATMNSRLSGPDQSLNAPLMEGDGESADRQDFLVDDRPNQGETVSEALDQERRSEWLKSAMSVLSERELRIVRERRLSEDGATLEALGKRLGISKERVRQIECRALEKLKVALVESQPGDTAFV
ncbi:MAG: sigma-70 family RNA polymerase sigma factor, partial [Hyphomicrobiales bacterium]